MFKSERRIKFDYARAIITSLVLPIGYLLLWYYSFPATWRELQLLTHNTKTTNGYVTKAEEIEDYVETNNDRKIERKLDFTFEYSFTLPNGESITSYGSEPGPLPDDLRNISEKVKQVEVEYLPNNPQTNRIKAMWTGEKSILQWFRHRFVIGFLVFLFFCYWGYLIYKGGRKNYSKELADYNKAVQEYRSKIGNNL
jgi:hypothetical protein